MAFPIFSRASRAARGSDLDSLRPIAIELERDAFVRWLEGPLDGASGLRAGFALLVVNLRRSDRTASLLRRASAQACDTEATQRIAEALRPQDRFTWLGPEHLLLALPRITDPSVVTLAVNRLLGNFDAPIGFNSEKFMMRPCLGCALSLPGQPIDLDALLSAANKACAVAGSNESGFALADPMQPAVNDADEMLPEFQSALDANELEVWFQPQRNVASGGCLSAEALLRWRSKRWNRMISPMLMAEMAERFGLTAQLTTFVLNSALRQLTELGHCGIDLRIAVNTSPSLLRESGFPELVARALAIWGIAPERLTLEMTEGTVMADAEQSLRVLRSLKEQRVRVSIDHFGTGYSSIAHLRRMPLDQLKIDKTFVQGMLQNRGDEQIVRSVIDLAHNFELEVVAEGVEDLAVQAALSRLGCDAIQGFAYARPMPIAQIPAWWAARER